MSKDIAILLILLVTTRIFPQNLEISLNGFIKTDVIFDSRQIVTLREGHFLLYPQNQKLDSNNIDINAKGSFNILSIQTRIIGNITGPKTFDANTAGLIEAEFFGTSDADINGFRLRHAYIKFDWEKTSLLVGQTWHPFFVAEVFPGVVSFNTGAPFQPFSRNPQIRFSQNFNNIRLILTAASQRDFSSNGPDGFSTSYLRNSSFPIINAQVQLKKSDNVVGMGLDFKKLTPRLVTNMNFATDKSISSLSFTGYLKFNLDLLTIKSQLVYGNNLTDLMMLGGYAVKAINLTDGQEEYTGIKVFSAWSEIVYGKEIELGLFGGYSKNLGANDNIIGNYYGRAFNIDNLFRISPRVQINSGKSRISTELEYTAAAYGRNDNTNKGRVIDTRTITNLRLLLAVYYFF